MSQGAARRRSFLTLFFTLLLVIVVPLSLLLVFFVTSSTTMVRRDYINFGQLHADTVRGTLNTYLNARLNLVYDMRSNLTIRKLAASIDIPETELREDCVHVAALLRAFQTDDSVFSLAAIYLPGRELVIHPRNAHMKPEAFYQQHIQLEGLSAGAFYQSVRQTQTNHFHHSATSRASHSYGSDMILFIQPVFLGYLSHRAYFISMISSDAFSRLVLRSFDRQTHFRVFDGKGVELLHSPGIPEAFLAIQGADAAGQAIRHRAATYHVFFSAGTPVQLQYLFFVPEGSVLRQLGTFITVWFAALALCLAVGILIARQVAKRVYAPIYSLLEEAFPDGASAQARTLRDEVALVAEKMRVDETRTRKAEKELQEYYRTMRDMMLTRLLTQSERMSSDEISESAELAGVSTQGSAYRVAVLENESPDGFDCLALEETDSKGGATFIIQQSAQQWMVLNAYPIPQGEDGSKGLIAQLESLPPNTRAGISRRHDDIHELQTCLREAFAAMRRHDPDAGRYTLYDDLLADSDETAFPPEQELLLMSMVRAGASSEVNAQLADIMSATAEDGGLLPEAQNVLYYRLIRALQKAAAAYPADTTAPMAECLHALQQWMDDHSSGPTIQATILNGYQILCGIVYKANRTKNRLVMDNVQEYLQAQYADQALCLDAVADHLGVSYYFLSRIFREETNRSFSELLNDIRVSHAIRLLGESSLSVQEIGASVGYTNWSTFLRAFRKRTGTTPLRYRKDGNVP